MSQYRNQISDEELLEFVRTHKELSPGDIGVELRQKGYRVGKDRIKAAIIKAFPDFEILEENVRLAKSEQKHKDLNRIRGKAFREHARIENALTECSERILDLLGKYDLSKVTVQHETLNEEAQGVIQLSDLHFNELVNTQMNVYDFRVASKRLKKFAIRAKQFLSSRGVKSVLVANTGDILNSDRRLDEYLNEATNRMNAMMLAVLLLEQFLLDLNETFNVTYVQVSGNESRVKDEPGYADNVMSDNYDAAIYNILKYGMKSAKGINFVDGDPAEKIVSIYGHNILVTHGEQIKENSAIKDVQNIKGKYAQYGVAVDFVVFGHIHAAHIHDLFARSASLVGANAYSDRALQLSTRASQNIHVFTRDGSHDSYLVDLQNTAGIEGYRIEEELEAYNAKSEKKLHAQTSILEIVI